MASFKEIVLTEGLDDLKKAQKLKLEKIGGKTQLEILFDFANEIEKSKNNVVDLLDFLSTELGQPKNLLKLTDKEISRFLGNVKRWNILKNAPGKGKMEIDTDFYGVITAGGYKSKTPIPTTAPVAEPEEDEEESKPGEELSRKVTDMSKLRISKKPFRVPVVNAKNSFYMKKMESVLNGMLNYAEGASRVSFMISGAPGSGKTQFVKALANVCGLSLIVIEAPHIVEEHVIQIPFIVFDNKEQSSYLKGNTDGLGNQSGIMTIEKNDNSNNYKIVHSESNLISIMKKRTLLSDEQHWNKIKNNKNLRDIYTEFGDLVKEVRKHYKSILFVDEYYRQTKKSIRNIMRSILDRKIGNVDIPEGVYPIFASNMSDASGGTIAAINQNEQFREIEYEIKTKDDWMNFMYSKYVTDSPEGDGGVVTNKDGEERFYEAGNKVEHIKLDPRVYEAFDNLITVEMFGHESNDVALSARRMEQIIIYVNASLPCPDRKSAGALLNFVKTNLKNYLTEDTSDLYQDFLNTTRNLITETSGFDASNIVPTKDGDWRDVMKHQIEMKMKLEDERTYIPVVSGLPGIGKTKYMGEIAKELNMKLVTVNVMTLNADDVIGIPTPHTENGVMQTKFTKPALYDFIMSEYAKAPELKPGQKYRCVVFFDELNRPDSVDVFNAIRKILLEKEFGSADESGETYKLPSDMIMTAAINPYDTGTMELSSHVRDVLDIISSEPKFYDTIAYMSDRKELKKYDERVAAPIRETMANVIKLVGENFRHEYSAYDPGEEKKLHNDQQPFHWKISDDFIIYMSPRNLSLDIHGTVVAQTTRKLEKLNYLEESNNWDDAKWKEVFIEIMDKMIEAWEESLIFVGKSRHQHGKAFETGVATITNWIRSSKMVLEQFDLLRISHSNSVPTLLEIFSNPDNRNEKDEANFEILNESYLSNYLNSGKSIADFMNDLSSVLDSENENVYIRYSFDGKLTTLSNISTILTELYESVGLDAQLKDMTNLKLKDYIKSGLLALTEEPEMLFDFLIDDDAMNKLETFIGE